MARHVDSVRAIRKAAPATKKEAVIQAAALAAANPVTPTADSKTADTYDSLFPEPAVSITSPPNWLIWLLCTIILVGGSYAAYVILSPKLDNYLSLNTSTPRPSESATTAVLAAIPTASPTPTPTPTPSATPASTPAVPVTVTLRVLNGTTKSGAAATGASALEKAGFTVRTTGNATSRSYGKTTIYYQAGRQKEAEAVQRALSGYTTVLEQSALASPDMVLVVIGLT